MGRKDSSAHEPLDCGTCRDQLQEYLDGTLVKKTSLQLFLHMRDCADCQTEHDRLAGMFQLLDGLPDFEPPVNFDEKILASVNYQGYRAMENIRRERVPVYLEEEFLPSWVRSVKTRVTGFAVAGLALFAQLGLDGPAVLPLFVLAGIAPELLVRLQGVGRRVVMAQLNIEDSES